MIRRVARILDHVPLLGFSEIMRGTWTPADDTGRQVFEFDVRANADRAGAFLTDGRLALTGQVRAGGLTEGAPATGEMALQPWVRRRVGYRLAFTGDDGQAYTFEGQKQIRARHLVRSWTTLPGEMRSAGGHVIGRALLRFDLRRDFGSLLASVRPARPGAVR